LFQKSNINLQTSTTSQQSNQRAEVYTPCGRIYAAVFGSGDSYNEQWWAASLHTS